MKGNLTLKLMLLLAILLAACGPNNSFDAEGAPLQAWIDAPLNGSALPVENYTLIFSGASQEGAVDGFDIWVNGVEVDNVPAGYQTSQDEAQYSFGQYDWLPAAPGNYLIQVRALSGDAVSDFAEAHVVVGELVQDESAPQASPTPGEDSLVAIPTQNVNCREGNSNQFDIADTVERCGNRISGHSRSVAALSQLPADGDPHAHTAAHLHTDANPGPRVQRWHRQ